MRYNIQIQQQAQSSTTHMPFCRTALLLSVEVSAAAVCRSKHNAISSAAVAAVRHKHRQQYIARSSHRYATPVTAAPPSSWLSLSFSFQLSLSYRIVLRDRRGRQVRWQSTWDHTDWRPHNTITRRLPTAAAADVYNV